MRQNRTPHHKRRFSFTPFAKKIRETLNRNFRKYWLFIVQSPDGKTINEMDTPKQLSALTQFIETIYDILSVSSVSSAREKKDSAAPAANTMLLTPLPPRKIDLIGREKDLEALEKTLRTSTRAVLVNGLGGIGKTEVCKAFFHKHYTRYRYAAWIDWISSLKESIAYALGSDKSTFIQADEKDTIDERFDKIMIRLRQTRELFLLVIDDIGNPGDADLDALASLPAPVKVLANSRNKIEGYEAMPLDFLSPPDCRELFYRFYTGNRDDESVDRVIELCGYHTLTVELLARTAYHSALSAKSLLEALKGKGFNLTEVTTGKISTFWHNEKDKRTFFEHLAKVFDISGVTGEELVVLGNVSVLPAVYIPMEWVREWLGLEGMDEMVSLVDKGWLKRDDRSRVYMHPVMQEVARYRTKPGAEMCGTLMGSLALKLRCEPGDNPIHKKEFIIYGESVVRFLAMDAGEKDKELATLANDLSLRYKDLGQLDRALGFQLKTVEIFEALLDPMHPDLATSYNNVSQIYLDLGQLDRALEFQLKANEIYEAVLDPNHPLIATSYNNISIIYQAMGQLDRALEFQLKDIEISGKILGENHPSLSTSYNNLSMIYKNLGQLDRALEIKLKGLKIEEAVFDKNHPQLASSYNNVSLIYNAMGQLDRALEFQSKTLQIKEAVLDPKHPSLATSYNNVSLIYKAMGRLDLALEFQLKAIEIIESVFDSRHPNLAASYNNVSAIYQAADQLDRALEFQLKALEIREAVLDPKHPDLATSYNNVSLIYKAMGLMERALEFQLKANEIYEAVLDPNHPLRAASYHNLSFISRDMKDFPAALSFAEKAVAIMETVFPGGHPNLDKMKKNLEEIKKAK